MENESIEFNLCVCESYFCQNSMSKNVKYFNYLRVNKMLILLHKANSKKSSE